MHSLKTPEQREITEGLDYRPALSVILPFEPKMSRKSGIIQSLNTAAEKVERELLENYPDEISRVVMQKLRAIISNLNFNTHNNSIAIFVSPVFEKVLYLNIAVEEKIIVDKSFQFKDILFNKKPMQRYLVLVLGEKASMIYLGNSYSLAPIVANIPATDYDHTANFPAGAGILRGNPGEKVLEKDHYIKHVDNTLDIILKAYQLPLFIFGSQTMLDHFKDLTKHPGAVVEFVRGDFETTTVEILKERMKPFIGGWKKIIQQDLLNQLNSAAGNKKLAVGMWDVWREAKARKGRLLVVEKDYVYAAQEGTIDEVIYKAIEPYNKFSYIKNAVEDVMEKVLENGGDVELVDGGILKQYQQIALIQN